MLVTKPEYPGYWCQVGKASRRRWEKGGVGRKARKIEKDKTSKGDWVKQQGKTTKSWSILERAHSFLLIPLRLVWTVGRLGTDLQTEMQQEEAALCSGNNSLGRRRAWPLAPGGVVLHCLWEGTLSSFTRRACGDYQVSGGRSRHSFIQQTFFKVSALVKNMV